MGTKYTIEVEDKPFELLSEDGFTSEKLYRVKGFNSLVFDRNGLNMLTPYTEPDLEQVREEAKEEGYSIGYDEGREAGVQQGLSDAWEAARKIVDCAIPYEALENYLEIGECTADVIKHLPASKAIEVVRQYEQEKEEYHIGDEVIRHYKNEFMEGDDTPSIFLSEEDGQFRCLAFNGRSIMIAEYPKNQYRKTGRHFPEIAEVLKKMRETTT